MNSIVCPINFVPFTASNGLDGCRPDSNLVWTCDANDLKIVSIKKEHLFGDVTGIPDAFELSVGDFSENDPDCKSEQSFDINTPNSAAFKVKCYDTINFASNGDIELSYRISAKHSQNQAAFPAVNYYEYEIGCTGASAVTIEKALNFNYLVDGKPVKKPFTQFPDGFVTMDVSATNIQLRDPFTLTITNEFSANDNVHAMVDSCSFEYSDTTSGGLPPLSKPFFERCVGGALKTTPFVDSSFMSWQTDAKIAPTQSTVLDMKAFIFNDATVYGADALNPTVKCNIQFCQGPCDDKKC